MSPVTDRVRRLCTALPQTTLDRRFGTLSRRHKLIALGVTSLAILTIPSLLTTDPVVQQTLGLVLAFAVLDGLTRVLHGVDRR